MCHGKPVVRGLRYPVETLVELALGIAAGKVELSEGYPMAVPRDHVDVSAALTQADDTPELWIVVRFRPTATRERNVPADSELSHPGG